MGKKRDPILSSGHAEAFNGKVISRRYLRRRVAFVVRIERVGHPLPFKIVATTRLDVVVQGGDERAWSLAKVSATESISLDKAVAVDALCELAPRLRQHLWPRCFSPHPGKITDSHLKALVTH